MSDTRLLYTYPSDEWAHLLTPTFVVGAADADFPIANLFDGNPALPFKATGTSLTLQWNRGSAQPGGLIALPHWNLDGTVTWLRSNDPTFVTGVLTFPFTVTAKDTEGYFDGFWVDTSLGAATKQYERLVITGNSQIIQGGQLFASSVTRVLPHHVSLGSQWGAHRPRIKPLMTVADVQMGQASFGRRRQFSGSITYDPTVSAAVDAWLQACGGIDQPCLIVPKDTNLASAWFVRWSTANNADFLYTDQETGIVMLSVGWIEVAKGRPYGSV